MHAGLKFVVISFVTLHYTRNEILNLETSKMNVSDAHKWVARFPEIAVGRM